MIVWAYSILTLFLGYLEGHLIWASSKHFSMRAIRKFKQSLTVQKQIY